METKMKRKMEIEGKNREKEARFGGAMQVFFSFWAKLQLVAAASGPERRGFQRAG